ncbi:mate-domain-containing protein [Phascolomyces articulosus]|uniref:Mate-domain-containing protein n=1 Tax=Phascolomyces articulosus TaxID=60185 RepID=A0AAD5K296_9FUNG|nr:mate-domain-containing protein [Phascolomyces articulosus]
MALSFPIKRNVKGDEETTITRHNQDKTNNNHTIDERTTLLSSSPSSSSSLSGSHDDEDFISQPASISHVDHAKWIIKKCIPLLMTSLLHQVTKWIVIISAGHLGSTDLSAIALAHVFENLSAKLSSFSLRSALSTLCSQAWTGAKDKSLVGVYLQRGLMIYFVICLVIFTIWANSDSIFKILKQDPDIAHSTETYLLYQFPGYVAHGCYVITSAFLQAQGIMRATVFALSFSVVFHLIVNYILVYYAGLGIIGISVALTLNYFMTIGLLALYSAKIEGYEGWGDKGWTRQCLKEWGPVLHHFLPASLGSLWSVLGEALITFSVSYLGKTELAAQAILQRSSLTFFSPGRGLRTALSNRVGNHLGLGSPNEAKRAYFVGAIMALALGIFYTVVLMAYRKSYAYLFTSDDDVAAVVSSVIPVFAVTQTVDMFKSLGTGVLQGLGRQKVIALVSFFSDFVLAIPLCYIFTFKLGGGLVGLWSGIACGNLACAIVQLSYIWIKIDWIREAKHARKRIEDQQDKLSTEVPIKRIPRSTN